MTDRRLQHLLLGLSLMRLDWHRAEEVTPESQRTTYSGALSGLMQSGAAQHTPSQTVRKESPGAYREWP